MNKIHQIYLGGKLKDLKKIYEIKISTILNNISGTYHLWNEDEIINLIKTNFDGKVLDAYNSLNSNALKADLARYCILYVHGGWYFDLLMSTTGDMPFDHNDCEMVVFRDMTLWSSFAFAISNSIIKVNSANHNVMKYAIEIAVDNILNKRYPEWGPHAISGPVVLGQAIVKHYLDNDEASILVGELTFLPDRPGVAEFWFPSIWFPKESSQPIHVFAHHRMPGDQELLPAHYQKNSLYNEMFYNKTLYK